MLVVRFDQFRIIGTGPDRSTYMCPKLDCKAGYHHTKHIHGSTQESKCVYNIAYTSFEEPTIVGGNSAPKYFDSLGSDSDHELLNNPGQNQVSYAACGAGTKELGFRTFYGHMDGRSRSLILADGHVIGVIGDSTTSQKADKAASAHGGQAPDGSQYYSLEETGGFTYVQMDPVDVSEYEGVSMTFWAFFQSTSWEQNDLVRVWATDIEAKQEWSVLRATVAGDSAYAIDDLGGRIAEDRWVEYSGELSGNLPLNGTVSMSFGMYSDSSSVQVWFDHFRIQGLGPERHALFCQPDNCTRGSYRNYVPGSPGSQATCELCPPGSIDDDANPTTACTMCEAGRYSNSTTSCVACPGFPERAISPVGSSKESDCMQTRHISYARHPTLAHNDIIASDAMMVGYTSFEEPMIVLAEPKCTGGCDPICSETGIFDAVLGGRNGITDGYSRSYNISSCELVFHNLILRHCVCAGRTNSRWQNLPVISESATTPT